jgi:hypothetical protein
MLCRQAPPQLLAVSMLPPSCAFQSWKHSSNWLLQRLFAYGGVTIAPSVQYGLGPVLVVQYKFQAAKHNNKQDTTQVISSAGGNLCGHLRQGRVRVTSRLPARGGGKPHHDVCCAVLTLLPHRALQCGGLVQM